VWLAISLFAALPARAQQEPMPAVQPSEDWCGTQRVYEQKYFKKNGRAPKACEQLGICDDPATRDGWIFTESKPVIYVRMVIHYFAEDDGQLPTTTPEEIAAQVENLNADYLPVGIQFIVQTDQVNSFQWKILEENEIDAMKTATAISPDSCLNVWVPYVTFSYSFGTFPWSDDAQTATGGIVMGQFHWQGGVNNVFTHEVGHTLGLWHVFHGIDEVTQCGSCYEYVAAPEAEGNLLGDFCHDTPPSPTERDCANAPGSDACSGLPWGYTQPENYMGYADEYCLTLFTPQQWGRLRCWTSNALDSWTEPFTVETQNVFGPLPLDASFAAATHREALAWHWDFGDGQSSDSDSVIHPYEQPGYYSVSVQLTTPGGVFDTAFPGLVSVYADTVKGADIEGEPGQTVRVDVSVHNYLPLKEILIPVCWNGPLNLSFQDYSTAGLRTAYFETQSLATFNSGEKRAAIDLICSNSGAQPYLEPGDGPVVSLYFKIPSSAPDGVGLIDLSGFTTWNPLLTTYAGTYAPVVESGSIGVGLGCCAEPTVGNVDRSTDNLITMGDLTVLIDFLYVSLTPPACLEDADVDLSGQPDPETSDIGMSDLTVLIDHLYISLSPLPACP